MSPGAGGGEGVPGRRATGALRGPKVPLDPWRPIRTLRERERLAGVPPPVGSPSGSRATSPSERPSEPLVAPALAIFLAGAECPFRCVFCDLWRETLDGPTPAGAIATQVRLALDAPSAPDPSGDPPPLGETVIKLYNASNFFDPRAVPVADLDGVAALLAPARRVVVECHPRLVLGRGPERGEALCRRFAEGLTGVSVGESDGERGGGRGGASRLEVAMGLETVHPEAFPRLDKGMALDDFDRAAERLLALGVAVRAFVLVGAPFVPPEEAVDWAVRSVAHALAAGATHVALIPVRGGQAALEELAARGDFTPPRLEQLEEALARSLALTAAGADHAGAVVTADLWDLERFAACRACLPARRAQLERANLTGVLAGSAAACPECGWEGGRGG